MKRLLVLFMFVLPCLASASSEHIAYQMPKTWVIPIQDSQSDRQYELYIKLPEGYEENQDSIYPVIYFTDAVWHIELLSASTEYLMEKAILVGISWQKDISEDVKKNVGVHASRFRDYTIKPSDKPERQAKYQLGQAGKHLAFIRNDVINYVERNYRADPNKRSYFGYSAGGLFGAYILMVQPNTFQNYILGSPSLKGNLAVLSELRSNAVLKSGQVANVLITNGALEEELSVYIKEFISMLENKNENSLTIQQAVLEGSHQTAFPMTGVRSIHWLSNLASEKE